MSKIFWSKINKLEELAKKATQGEWRSGNNTKIYSKYEGMPIPVAKVFSEKDIEYIIEADPAMIKEMIAEMRKLKERLHKTELHEHYLVQWAELDKEEAHKNIDWMHEIQEILGMEIGMTQWSRKEITEKIKALMDVEKGAVKKNESQNKKDSIRG